MRWCCGASSIAPAGPRLTAKQLTKKKEEAEIIAAQLAKPSYWDKVGPNEPNASALKAALADTVLVDAAWLVRLAKKRGILPRCQDLPPGARVTLEEMEKWRERWTAGHGPLGVVVISYPWLDADHPDKDGLQLRKIAKVLKIFDKHAKEKYGAGCKVGVFLDYVSMPQRSRGSPEDDRTPEELATFKRSLQGINSWYANGKTHVLLVDTPLPKGKKTNVQPYAGRGWCVMESKASGLVKDDYALISLKGLTGEETEVYEVRNNGKAARAPPMAPAAFKAMLEAGVASGAIKFTHRGDVGTVVTIYGKAFVAETAAVVALSYAYLGWDDAQVLTVCVALRAAHAGGGLRKVEKLHLGGNQMGDGAAAALAALVEEGAMPNLKELRLHDNRIAADGVSALASALRGGALPNLKSLHLDSNQISDEGVAALASALRGGALPSCTTIRLENNPGSDAKRYFDDDSKVKEALASPERLKAVTQNATHMAAVVELNYRGLGWDDAQVLTLCEALRAAHAGGGLRKVEELILRSNKMGDGAAAALAALLEEGVMPNLKRLDLFDSQISNAGVAALASALRGGALPACEIIDLQNNQIGDDGVAALAFALRGGALPSCMWIALRGNQIADDGVAALASALRGGALPACEGIDLTYNQIGDDGVAALASALRGGALPSCTTIRLENNPGSDAKRYDDVDSKVKEALASPERLAAVTQNAELMAAIVKLNYRGLGWDDAQVLTLCEALRAAHADGGLRKVETLSLGNNQMGDGAAAALAALVEEGAMPNLKVLLLYNNRIGDDGVAALASALRGGALPACEGIDLDDNAGSGAPVKEALASPERAAALARRRRRAECAG